MTPSPGVARTRSDITADWISRILGVAESCPVTSAVVQPVGSGQMGALSRADLTFIGVPAENVPSRVIVKQAAESTAVRTTCAAMGIYENEVRFFRHLAPHIGPAVPVCYFAAVEPDTGWFTIVLEDLNERAQPVDTRTGRVDKAARVLAGLAEIQAKFWNDPALESRAWLSPTHGRPFFDEAAASTTAFLERFGDRLERRHVEVFERLLPRAADWVRTWTGPLTVSHGDFRWDNMMFTHDGSHIVVVDWQAVRLAPPLLDVAFFLGACLREQERLDNEQMLLERYLSALRAAGVTDYTSTQCWRDYRRNSMYGLLIAGLGARATRTVRGDDIIAKGARNAADFILSLDAEDLFA